MKRDLIDERPSVLVIEDEAAFSEALEAGLGQEGFRVTVASDGVSGLESFSRVHPDVVLLDLMLPNLSGTEVCKALRRTSDCPIVVVTARREEIDAVVALELGADDYVTKPFRLRELAARIRAVLRRSGPGGDLAGDDDGRLQGAGVELDAQTRQVTVAGAPVDLTRKEFDLLEVLMLGAGRVQTRQRLLDEVWGVDYFGDTKTLDVHIRRLRAKLGSGSLITTFRGVGYRFNISPEKTARRDGGHESAR